MPRDLRLLLDRIHELSDERADVPPKPLLAVIEHTLTDGYAVALALEGESWRIQRRIAELASRLEQGTRTEEMRHLGDRLVQATDDLDDLRASLATLRRRAERVRARVDNAA